MSKYTSYILYLLIAVLVVVLFINDFGPLAGLQRSLNDALLSFNAPSGVRPNVALVTIDGRAEDAYGSWPWNHDLIADLLAATAHGDPKVIVAGLDVSEDARQDSAGFTAILSEQVAWIKNVVFPYDIAIATFRSNKTDNPEYLFDYSVSIDNPLGLMKEESSLQVRKVFLPADKVLASEPYLGFEYIMPDDDRTLRYQPLLMNYEGYYYPSISLMAASVYLDVSPEQIQVIEGEEVRLGNKQVIPVTEKSEMLVSFAKGRPFATYSAADLLGDTTFAFERLKNKIVLIGVMDPAYVESFDTPVGETKPRLIVKANVIENIVNDNLVQIADDHALLSIFVILLLGGICAAVLPQISTMYRMIVLLGGFVILANVNYFMLTSFQTIPQTVFIAFELLLFVFASPFADSSLLTGMSDQKKAKQKLPADKLTTTQDIDESEAPVREIKASSTDPEEQSTEAFGLGESDAPIEDPQAISLDQEHSADEGFEESATESGEKQGTDRTSMVRAAWEDDESDDVEEEPAAPPIDEDSGSVVRQSGGIDEDREAIVGTGSDSVESRDPEDWEPEPVDGLESNSDAIIKPPSEPSDSGPTASPVEQLGRYKVTSLLGRGAMGQVYRGVDPAINRPVALKTIRLDFVNDPNEMAELKERLHREAQAAGKLSHPNIVTIYDVGSEGHLQYIAMEFLEGQTLEDMIKKKTTFNYKIIAKIIIQICSALEYAHEQNIVHRDIKPANIMILKDYSVKVMDFGIARVDSTSMTKTGIAMGTPNYISPEQLQGLPVDTRADLFSLGVVMYELLVGKRPFRGENITSLIYAILNHEPQKPSEIDGNIPPLFDHIISKALKKNPKERYQKSTEITTDLFDFVESFAAR